MMNKGIYYPMFLLKYQVKYLQFLDLLNSFQDYFLHFSQHLELVEII